MAIQRIVNSRFTVNDKITKRFGIMERAAARFGRGAEKSFRRASKSASSFGAVTKGVVAGIGITRGLGLLSRGVGTVVDGFIAFDKAALGATVRFKDIGPEAANFNDQLKLIRASARDAGATTEFTAAQAGAALDFLARAGFSSAEAMGALRSMIDLSTAAGEDFATVADQSSDLLGAFGLNADNTAEKIANLNRLNDVLVKTANSANVTIEDMFETMKLAAPIGRTLGIELEEVAALTAVMGNAGIKGSQAATALKNSFLNLSTGAPKVTKMLDAIGVRIDDGQGNMRKFTDILEDVGKNIKGLGSLQQSKVLDTLFGKRAIAGASNLIDSIGEVKQFEKSLLSAGATSQKTAEIMRTSIDARLKALQSAATELGFKILEAFEVKGKKGIDSLTEAIRNFDATPIIDFFKSVQAGLAFIWEWRGAIAAVAVGFILLKTALAAAQIAMLIFNIATAANPIGLIVLGVFALIAGFTALVIWIDDVIASFDSMSAPLRLILGIFKLIFEAIKLAKEGIAAVLGFGDDDEESEGGATPRDEIKVLPPAEIAAIGRSEAARFRGRLDIAGAPAGSVVTTEPGSDPGFDIGLLGPA